jgi:2-polyprenyl-6-methoxyphenol hydroxylase-like FAD-dependent oxidoreductase
MPLAATLSEGRIVQQGKNAIVIGASMAGLLTARVLADFYEQVRILERDPLESGTRQGVPQGRHVHVMLVGGANAIQSLFPGLFDELAQRGRLSRTFLLKTFFGSTMGCGNYPQPSR